jgi:ribosomal protein S6--L-glutamate ligase
MHIAILSRNKSLYSMRRLRQEAKNAAIRCDVINPLSCQLLITPHAKQTTGVLVGNTLLKAYDAIVPRIGTSITDYGLAVVKHFELQDLVIVNHSQAIAQSRNKMLCLQKLSQAGLLVPATVLTRSNRGLKTAVECVQGLPVVLKVLQGTQGIGVMLVNTPISVGSVLDTLRTLNQDVLIQQFIAEGQARDFRVFVVGKQVIAAMMRTAARGEFRSNIHRGAEGKIVQLPRGHETLAIRATQVLGLEIAGVDIMESRQGPMVIEVNSSPGFEGIEKATGINVAQKIIHHIQELVKQKKRKSRRR